MNDLPPNLGQAIDGIFFSHNEILAILNKLAQEFDRTDLDDVLSKFVPADSRPDIGHRVLQNLRRKGVIEFDSEAQVWRKTAQLWRNVPRTPPPTNETLPLLETGPVSVMPLPSADNFKPWVDAGHLALSGLACLSLIAALITLNASFAWELGGERWQFQIALVVALMALDLMRPFLVAAGFSFFNRGKNLLAGVAITVALLLSPVSILSSTSILSASFLLGAEMNSDAARQTETRVALQAEHARLLDRAAHDEAAWRLECARGGCGALAADLEQQFQTTIAQAKSVLDRIVRMSDAEQGNSALLARMVTTFEGLGLFGAGRQILLPLLLAISLEIAALFGPALLLRRRS